MRRFGWFLSSIAALSTLGPPTAEEIVVKRSGERIWLESKTDTSKQVDREPDLLGPYNNLRCDQEGEELIVWRGDQVVSRHNMLDVMQAAIKTDAGWSSHMAVNQLRYLAGRGLGLGAREVTPASDGGLFLIANFDHGDPVVETQAQGLFRIDASGREVRFLRALDGVGADSAPEIYFSRFFRYGGKTFFLQSESIAEVDGDFKILRIVSKLPYPAVPVGVTGNGRYAVLSCEIKQDVYAYYAVDLAQGRIYRLLGEKYDEFKRLGPFVSKIARTEPYVTFSVMHKTGEESTSLQYLSVRLPDLSRCQIPPDLDGLIDGYGYHYDRSKNEVSLYSLANGQLVQKLPGSAIPR